MEHRFIQDRDIIMFSMQPWDAATACNFKEMALEFAKHNRVLYVNRAPDRISLIRHRSSAMMQSRLATLKDGTNELISIQPNLWVHNPRTILESLNWMPFPGLYEAVNRINSKRLAKEINKTTRSLGFRDALLINDNDFFRGIDLKELVECSDYIFYIRDYLNFQRWFRRHGPRMEKKMMEKVDLVVANSVYLANYAGKYNRHSYDIGQGCDLESYLVKNPPLPDDLASIQRPIIGYSGAISGTRLDKDIFCHIAKQLPHCSVVLVGPVTDHFDVEALRKFPNIHLLGVKPPAAVPGYVHYFDVCINPQLVNQLTVGNYPRKADEYLAMGKPMVATRTETMEFFADHVFLCNNKEEYVTHIKNILSDPALRNGQAKENRKEFALSHSWTESIGRLGDAYFKYQSDKNKEYGRRQLA
ncbi:MAG TPA: glycosyltransferase [Chitinophagaceae bacterium]